MKIKVTDVVEATALALFNFKTNFMSIETTIEENRNLVKPYFVGFKGSDELSRQDSIEIGAHALHKCINSPYITLALCRGEMDCIFEDEDDFEEGY